jgi:hypothetical protein
VEKGGDMSKFLEDFNKITAVIDKHYLAIRE